MPVSLYDAFVPTCRQIIGSVSGLLDKAEAHCRESGLPEAELIATRLAPDMFDFAYQVKSCAVHSAGAIEGVRAGSFSPDMTPPPDSFAGLRARLAIALETLDSVTAAEMEELVGREMHFTIPGRVDWAFTAETFLLTFSQPNFHFHATTAYDLLRLRGLKIGKLDYLGAMRIAG